VTINLVPGAGAGTWLVEEILPAGLTVNDLVGPNGTWNDDQDRIYWQGGGSAPVTLSYHVSGPEGMYPVSGTLVTDLDSVDISGAMFIFLKSTKDALP